MHPGDDIYYRAALDPFGLDEIEKLVDSIEHEIHDHPRRPSFSLVTKTRTHGALMLSTKVARNMYTTRPSDSTVSLVPIALSFSPTAIDMGPVAQNLCSIKVWTSICLVEIRAAVGIGYTLLIN